VRKAAVSIRGHVLDLRTHMAIATGTRLGPYEILAPLGAGGMGEVYRARDSRIGREVAVKVLPSAFASDPDRLRRFEQEARAAGALNHPNILVLHDVGTHEGTPYLVTELLDGETLRSRIDGAALSPRKAIDIALQIARGLAAAHERGLVHRDLKPDNVFVIRDGRVKILDFGIAKLTRPEVAASPARTAIPTVTSDTDPGTVLGTAGYMAPEQVRGQATDHRTDIFAFGAILYEMLSGRRAFRGDTNAETMTAILREEPPEIARDGRALPPALDRIVRHCLEKSPQERFQSASDIGFALEALSGVSDSGPKPIVAGASGRGGAWRRFIVPAIAALLLLTAGALAGRQFAGPRSQPPVEYRKLTYRRGPIAAARFSKDARTIYYSAEWDGNPRETFVTSLDAPGSRSAGLPQGSYLLSVSSTNELAVLLRAASRPHMTALGTLARMTPGGAPREILDDVTDADWSPDGSSLAVIRIVGGRYQLEYPIGTVLYQPPGWLSHLRVSPDGRSLAFLEHPIFPDDRGYPVVLSAGVRRRAVGSEFSSVQGLAWSLDGKEIWFGGAARGSGRSILAMNSRGRVRTVASLPTGGRIDDLAPNGDALVTTDAATIGILARASGETKERDLSWLDWSVPDLISRDGRTLIFEEEGGGGEHYSVCMRGMDGSPPVRLGEGESMDLTQDGKWVLVYRFWLKPPELVLLPTGAGQPRILPPVGLENVAMVRIFESGTKLLIIGNEPGRPVMAYVRPLEGGPLRPVTPEGVQVRRGLLSPDERWILGSAAGGWVRLFPLEGGDPVEVRGKLLGETAYGWSQDGKAIYVGRTGGSQPPVDLYRLDLATGKRSLWARLEGPSDRAGAGVGFVALGHDDYSYAYLYARALSELFLAKGLR